MENSKILTPVLILENRASLLLPVNTYDMPKERIETVYPMKNRPDQVIVYGKEECWFSFRMTEERLNDEDMGERLEQHRLMLKRAVPGIRVSNIITFDSMVAARTVHYFSVCSMGIESETYQYMYLFPIKGKTMIGTICCSCENAAAWEDKFKLIVASVVDLTPTWEYRINHKNLMIKARKYYESFMTMNC